MVAALNVLMLCLELMMKVYAVMKARRDALRAYVGNRRKSKKERREKE